MDQWKTQKNVDVLNDAVNGLNIFTVTILNC